MDFSAFFFSAASGDKTVSSSVKMGSDSSPGGEDGFSDRGFSDERSSSFERSSSSAGTTTSAPVVFSSA